MKVGDLVSVKLAHGQKPILGLILENYEMDGITASMRGDALVQPFGTTETRLMWANPLDIEVLNENR